jgi:hypothetical protein
MADSDQVHVLERPHMFLHIDSILSEEGLNGCFNVMECLV